MQIGGIENAGKVRWEGCWRISKNMISYGHYLVKYIKMAQTRRTVMKGNKGGMKNVGPVPEGNNLGILDVLPQPMHGYGMAMQEMLEQILGYSYDWFYKGYLDVMGGLTPNITYPMVEGDTNEERSHVYIFDMFRFLGEFKRTHDVTRAYNIKGLTRTRAYRIKSRNKFFSDRWDDINEERFDNAEKALYERAVRGVEDPVFSSTGVIGYKTKYSDDLLKFLLAGNRATIYRKAEEKVRQQMEIQMQVKGTMGIEGLDLKKLSDTELQTLNDLIKKANNGTD